MNTVIPEFVQRVNYEKGPYYADVGNYGSAGSAHLEFYKTLPKNFVQVEGGMYGYGRTVFGASQQLGLGNLLYGVEAYHDDGPWTHPDNYYKFNGLLNYSQGDEANGFSITGRGYHGNWHSSDQIPVWRKKCARGEVIVLRYADEIVLGFQWDTDADRFRKSLEERLGKFGLEPHPEKTRRLEFGRYAEQNRKRRGEGKPETFDFLGFTHISGKNGNGLMLCGA